ncbi:hypothetical protein IDVR_35550 [Intrasporangium sp. DVR]
MSVAVIGQGSIKPSPDRVPRIGIAKMHTSDRVANAGLARPMAINVVGPAPDFDASESTGVSGAHNFGVRSW